MEHIRQIVKETIKAYADKFEARGKALASPSIAIMADRDSLINDCVLDIFGDMNRHDRSVQEQLKNAKDEGRAIQHEIDQKEIDTLNAQIHELQEELKQARKVDPTNRTIGILEAKLSDKGRANIILKKTIDRLTATISDIKELG